MKGKTSVSMNPDVYRRVKARAAERGITVQVALEEAAQAWLGLPPPATEEPDIRLRRVLGGTRRAYQEKPELFDYLEAGLVGLGLLKRSALLRVEKK